MFRKEFLDEHSEEESLLTESDHGFEKESESEQEEEQTFTGESLFKTLLPQDVPVKEVLNKAHKLPNKVKMLAQVLKNAELEADKIIFGEEQREKIIQTASVFRKERDLKVVSKYWKRWKCII
jgi:hypothetical protein